MATVLDACISGWLQSIVGTIIGAVVGGSASFYFSRYYYKKAERELDATVGRLRTLMEESAKQATKFGEMLLYKLHNPETKTESRYDDQGKFDGLNAFMNHGTKDK